jgi:hypothetical protein
MMKQTSDTAAASGDNFDPQQAAALLDQTTLRARRQLTPGSPLLWYYRAGMLFVGLGGCWLSVRNQQPYTGPTASALAVLFALVGINVIWSSWMVKRVVTAVSGPAQRAWRIWGAAMLAVLIVAYAVIAPSYHPGITQPIWALYPISGPMMIVGLVGAVTAGLLSYQPITATLAAIAVVGAVAGFGGPVGEWLIMAIGLSVVCLGAAVIKTRQQRRSLVRP